MKKDVFDLEMFVEEVKNYVNGQGGNKGKDKESSD